MKTLILTAASMFAVVVHAHPIQYAGKFSCGLDTRNPYLLELVIDSIENQTGRVTVLRKSSKRVVRSEAASYKDGEFTFGPKQEKISIGSYDSFGDEFIVIYGFADIKEMTGSIHCSEAE